MKHSIALSPILGFGLGSTGYFEFESKNTEILESFNLEFLNKYDAYSGFFRMTIELGILFIIILFTFIYTKLKYFKLYVKKIKQTHSNFINIIDIHLTFIFIFSFTMVIGILIKEPTYSRSIVYVGWFLFVSSLNHTNLTKV